MSIYQLLSCDVALGGDVLNVVARHAFTPVTYAEMLVLKFIHGENAVTNICDVGAVERDDEDEIKRLSETYGADLVRTKMFPGAGTRLPAGDNRYKPAIVVPKPEVAPAPVAVAAVVSPEVVLPPGSVNYQTQAAASGPAAYVPVVPDAVPAPVPDVPDVLEAPTTDDGGLFAGPANGGTNGGTNGGGAKTRAPKAVTA